MNAEETLRRHVRRLLSESQLDRGLTVNELQQVEDDVLSMFADYGHMPAHMRNRVWAESKERVLERLRTQQRGATSGSLRYNAR